ncbi:MAG: permease [Nanoarchaeota archaeon]|nr:permease [Nanoarchaeota archaeon]
MKDKKQLKQAVFKAAKQLWRTFPVLVGAMLLVSLASALIPKEIYAAIFSLNPILDSFIGAFIGSILAGNPVTSYILGGEFLKQGVSLVAVSAFLIAWVTVGIVQLPAESMLLGRRFAFIRNITAFFFAIISAVATALIIGVL